MEYMAPEVLCMFGKRLAHKDGYTAAVDWWGLGVLTYHMITGAVPFRRVSYKTLEARMPKLLQQEASFETVFKKTFGSVSYDHPSFSPDTISLLQGLLTFDPDQRLGGTGLWEDVQTSNCPLRSHAFFKGIDWQLIERKAIQPPYLPHEEVQASISAGAYCSCIDSTITELLLRNNKVEWIDDDMELVYTPNVRFSSFVLSMNSLLRGSDSVSSKESSGRQMFGIGSPKKGNKVTPLTAEALAAHEMYRVKESDQVHFYGWNYVSQDLLETGKSTTDIVSTVNSISYSHSRGKSSYRVV
jgi:serine/threonine protein kinase